MKTYRKTKEGQWVVCGPLAEMHLGIVTVAKKDGGAKQETVVKLGTPFTLNGVPHVYGYIAPSLKKLVHVAAGGSAGGKDTKVCWECGCRFTFADARASGGDWQDGYCGC